MNITAAVTVNSERGAVIRVCHLRQIKADEYHGRLGDFRVKHVNIIAVVLEALGRILRAVLRGHSHNVFMLAELLT